MSTKRRKEVLIGGFLSLGLFLFVLVLLLMGSMDKLFTTVSVVEVEFANVQGLQEGDPVYLLGKKVGRVLSLQFVPPPPGERAHLLVELQIPEYTRPLLRVDSKVKVDKSLTGNISVLIQESDGPPLIEGGRLKGAPAADFGAVTEKINEVLSEGEKLVSTISRMVDEIETKGDLTSAVSDLSGLIKDVRSEVVPFRDQIRQILSALDAILQENRLDVRHTVANLKEGSAAAKTFAEKLGTTPELLERSLSEVQKAGASLSGAIGENRAHIDSILQDLRLASTSASNLMAEVKRRPWRLLYKPSESELEAIDLYDSAWAYNLGAAELNRSVRDLADVLSRGGGDPRRDALLEEATAHVRESLARQREAEDRFWEKLKASE